jgi:RNA polymerase sigma factor (sigma-70 family)
VTRNDLILEHLGYSDALSTRYFRSRHLGIGFDLEDVIAIGREGLIEAAGSYRIDEGTTFKSWAFSFIIGRIIDHIRHELGRRTPKPEMISYADALLQEPFSMSRDGLLDRICAKDAVARALSRMTRKQRLTFELHDIYGLTILEIADLEGVTVDAINIRRVNARKRIRRLRK